jgi:hypothetical protein
VNVAPKESAVYKENKDHKVQLVKEGYKESKALLVQRDLRALMDLREKLVQRDRKVNAVCKDHKVFRENVV